MRRLLYILMLPLILPSLLLAQQDQTQPTKLTLEECIQYALQNSVNAKNAVLDEEIAENVIIERRSGGLPQISGNVALQDNTKLPRFFTTYNPNPDQPSLGGDLSTIPGIKAGDVVAVQNFFQLPANGSASVTVNQMIFDRSYFLGLKAIRTYRELSVRTTEQTRQTLIINVIKAYYGVIINKDRINLYNTNISRVDSLLKNTKAMNQNGFAEDIDVDRIVVRLNNLIVEREKLNGLTELSLNLLKFQMNFPLNAPLELVGDIGSLQVDPNAPSSYEVDLDYNKRIEYKLIDTNIRLQELDIKAKKARIYPTISAYYNLGYTTQSPNVSGLFKTNSHIQDYGALGPDKWYQYSNYGVTMKIPIFGGLAQYGNVQQAKIAQTKLENQAAMTKSSIDMETKNTGITYTNAIKSLQSQAENKVLAEKIARITKIKYEQGVGSNIEVLDAEASLKETQVNYYNALYDALVAKVDLDKAYGKIAAPTTQEKK
jgi:outer membrane protein